jgi:hypothetical protein
MKNKKLFYIFLLILVGCAVILFAVLQRNTPLRCILQRKTPDQLWAEKTILAYIDAKGLDIPFCSARYNIFLRGILLGDAPELTKAPSPFVNNDAEVQHIIEYAAQNYYSQQELLLPANTEEPSFEAVP